MTPRPVRRHRSPPLPLPLLTATLVPGLAQLPALASSPSSAPQPTTASKQLTLGDSLAGPGDLDARGTALPSAAQRRAVAALGAVDVRWNQFGTPSSLLPTDGSLAPAPGDPVDAARAWLAGHAAVFGLTRAQVGDLELVNDQKLAQSPARAVLFRQRFGDLAPALDSMVTVGVANHEIAYASSSITKAA